MLAKERAYERMAQCPARRLLYNFYPVCWQLWRAGTTKERTAERTKVLMTSLILAKMIVSRLWKKPREEKIASTGKIEQEDCPRRTLALGKIRIRMLQREK